MKRIKTISASDHDTKIEVTIKVATNRIMARSESSEMIEGLASEVMKLVPHTLYFYAPLSKVKVR